MMLRFLIGAAAIGLLSVAFGLFAAWLFHGERV